MLGGVLAHVPTAGVELVHNIVSRVTETGAILPATNLPL